MRHDGRAAPRSVKRGERLSLNGEWQLSFGPQGHASDTLSTPDLPPEFTAIPATVPGNVELDLIRAGLLPEDLDRGQNAYAVLPYETHQWWYRRTFEIADLGHHSSPVLVLKGVDTVASIWLNGRRLARLDNMLIPHELDVADVLREGPNEIVVA